MCVHVVVWCCVVLACCREHVVVWCCVVLACCREHVVVLVVRVCLWGVVWCACGVVCVVVGVWLCLVFGVVCVCVCGLVCVCEYVGCGTAWCAENPPCSCPARLRVLIQNASRLDEVSTKKNQHDTRRGNFSVSSSRSERLANTNLFFKSYSPTTEEGHTSAAKTEHAVDTTNNYAEFQTASGIVRSTKEAKVYIQEVGTYLQVKCTC